MRPQSDGRASSELVAATPAAEARLWRVPRRARPRRHVKAGDRPVDEMLPWLLVERPPRQADELLRLPLGAPARRRRAADDARPTRRPGGVVFEVVDDQGLAGGRFALDASPDGATCVDDDRVGRADDAGPQALGAVSLGGVAARRRCTRAGWLDEHVAGAASRGRHAARERRSRRGATPGSDTGPYASPAVMDRGLRRIAIVNRGEAAMRLVNAVRELRVERGEDMRTIALHTAAERTAMFVREADEAVCSTRRRRAARTSTSPRWSGRCVAARADAAWVGWGFVAERPEFAELCDRLGIVFVGPSADVMRRLGDKIGAKLLAEQADVPVAPWSGGPVDDARRRPAEHAAAIGYPLMIKATAGGGGRGIRRVDDDAGLAEAFESARSEGLKAFGDATVFMERVVTGARHVEVQLIADAPRHGVGGRRARLQHAAAQPEGDRGVAVHRC